MKEFQGIQEFLSQWSSTTEKAKQDATDKKIMIGMFACSKVDWTDKKHNWQCLRLYPASTFGPNSKTKVGDEAQKKGSVMDVKRYIAYDIITNWDNMETIWDFTNWMPILKFIQLSLLKKSHWIERPTWKACARLCLKDCKHLSCTLTMPPLFLYMTIAGSVGVSWNWERMSRIRLRSAEAMPFHTPLCGRHSVDVTWPSTCSKIP